MPLDTPARLGAAFAEVKRRAAAAKRDPATLGLALLVQDVFEWKDLKIHDGSARRMFNGTSQQMREDAAALAAVGVGHVALRLGGSTIADTIERIERFGAEVIGK